MKKRILWMLAAILCCSLVMTSCTDEIGTPDNPASNTEQEPEQGPSDKGTWWLNESYMDKSVNPGDNFFMYCIGTWWKNTPVPMLFNSTNRFEADNKTLFNDKAMKLTDANYQKYLGHLVWAEDGSEAAKAGQKAYDDILALSGISSAATTTDVLKAFGKMGAMGVATCLWLEPFSLNGKICLLVEYRSMERNVADSDEADDVARQISLQKMIKNNPEVLAHLVPLGGKGGTRAIPEKYSGINTILEGMGFNPEDVYSLEDFVQFMNISDNESMKEGIERWQNEFLSLQTDIQTETPDELKKMLLKYHQADYGFISKATMEAYNKQLAEESKALESLTRNPGGDEPTSAEVLSLNTLKTTMENNYMPYLRSKMVADQLVPKGLKEDYLQYCKELKAVFAQRIKDNDWLSDGSKQNALEKLECMTFNVGYPDKWIDAGLADFSKNKSLVEDLYTLRKARIDLLKAIVGKKSSENSFTAIIMDKDSHLGVENAYYNQNYNSMNMLPYYILPPFYDATQSLAINYQCFDTMGHEMTHGFDNNGSMFDKNGDYKKEGIWASAADKAEFDRRAELLVKCYEGYDVLADELPGVKAVGKLTLPENIADLGGTEIAWQAFLNRLKADGYTGDQLKLMKQRFFLSYTEEFRMKYNAEYVKYVAFGINNPQGADVHSMNKERVNGVVANMDGWYDAFDIQGGALYRAPADRIHIW